MSTRNIFNIFFDFSCNDDPAHLRNLLAMKPQEAWIMYRLANCLAKEKHYLEAENLFLQAAAQKIDTDLRAEAWFRAGIVSLLDWRVVNGLERLLKADIIKRNNHELHIFLGICYYLLGIKWRSNIHWWASMQIKKTPVNEDLVVRFMGIDEIHPERCILYPLCNGKGIDVGCGHRKTHPDAIGVDMVPKGTVIKVGCPRMKESQADIQASGDQLDIFRNGELDYLVQRHNLEHYQDIVKTLEEWKRVVKPCGLLGMVIPDDEHCNTISLDPTHRHVFTQSSFRRLIESIGGLKILHLGVLLKNWSFVCILQKTGDIQAITTAPEFDYNNLMRRYQIEQALMQSELYQKEADSHMSNECRTFAEKLGESIPIFTTG